RYATGECRGKSPTGGGDACDAAAFLLFLVPVCTANRFWNAELAWPRSRCGCRCVDCRMGRLAPAPPRIQESAACYAFSNFVPTGDPTGDVPAVRGTERRAARRPTRASEGRTAAFPLTAAFPRTAGVRCSA